MNTQTEAMADQPQPLDDEYLAAIQTRDLIATKGPWGLYETGTMIDVAADLQETGCGYRARREIARFEDEPLDNDPAHKEWTAEEDWEQVRIDAEFVAHAREDVPALLAEVQRLKGRLAEYERPSRPNFFQIGHTYHRYVGDRQLYFLVTSISTTNPNKPESLAGDGPVAFGWMRTERQTTFWDPAGKTSLAGWRDVTPHQDAR